AGERIDHVETLVRGSRHQKPAVVCSEIKSGVDRPHIIAAAVRMIVPRLAISRAPTPPRPRLRSLGMGGIEAAGCPALVRHSVPSPLPKPPCGSTAAAMSKSIAPLVPRAREAQQTRRQRMAQGRMACRNDSPPLLSPLRFSHGIV